MSFSVSVKAARRIGNVARLIYWLCALSLIMMIKGCGEAGREAFDPYVLVDIAAFALLGSLAIGVRVTAIKLGQVQKQRECEQILGGDNRRPMVLFLRSFVVAEFGLTSKALLHLWGLIHALFEQPDFVLDVEDELDKAIGDRAVFLAIGNKHVSYGSAKLIVPDEKWQETFFQLAHSAEMIVMMPGPSTSTVWEMSQILNSPEALEKSVFIMLPAYDFRFSRSKQLKEEASWAALAKLVAEDFGVVLPKYRNRGCCFHLAPDRRVAKLAELEPFMRGLSKALSVKSSGALSVTEVFQGAQ